MPDLWKALGDVYGDGGHATRSTVLESQPVPTPTPTPAPPVPVPVAAAPAPQPLDADMAAALSAALVAPPPPVEPASAPLAGAPVADGPAQEQVTAWLADIENRRRLREQGPAVDVVAAEIVRWQRGDDDVLPAGRAPKGRRVRRRAA